MNAQGSASAFRKNLKISAGLCRLHNAERVLLSGHGQFHRVVTCNLQEDSGVRTAFVRLSGGMQKSRPKSQTGRNMLFIADGMAKNLQRLLMLRVHLDVSQRREVIPSLDSIQM